MSTIRNNEIEFSIDRTQLNDEVNNYLNTYPEIIPVIEKTIQAVYEKLEYCNPYFNFNMYIDEDDEYLEISIGVTDASKLSDELSSVLIELTNKILSKHDFKNTDAWFNVISE